MRARHVPPRSRPWFRTTAWLALVLLLQQPAALLAQATDTGQRLKAGDQIVLIVPSRPDLDQSLTLDAGGRVSIPQVGEVALAGLTVAEAREILRQRLRVFYPKVTAVEVDLQSATQMRLYVIGGVRSPGHYDFAVPPAAWDLLRAAGGPSEGADLARARVVRVEEDGATVVVEVDLSGVLDGRGAPDVVLRNSDTLVVPTAAAGSVTVLAHAGVQVFGAVATPTVVPLREPTELLQVLMLAGAPLTDSNLRKVYWVHRGPDGFRSNRVDVRRFLERGDPLGNPAVYPGDTIEVALYRPSWAARNLPLLLGMLATTATVVLAYDSLAGD